jgi:tetratricopeptide (TPR) repeat protein
VVLSTVAVNLKDCPPFASLSDSRLGAADRAKADQLLKEAGTLKQAGDANAAVEKLEEAVRVDSQSAEAQYRLGECSLARTNLTEARAAFERACDLDALPFRADTRINNAIRQAAADGGATLVDAAEILRTNSPAGICGDQEFYEHVHLTFDGNYLLARAWADAIVPWLPAATQSAAAGVAWASQEACERRLGLSDWNRCFVVQGLIRRFQQPPLSDQANNAQRLAGFREAERQLMARMTRGQVPAARAVFETALRLAPGDHYVHENFADFLESVREVEGALAEWRQVRELRPHDFLAAFQTGRLVGRLGRWSVAVAALRLGL